MVWLSIFLAALNFSWAAPAADKVLFPKGTLQIASTKLNVEIAETREQLEHGLMFRDKLGDKEGMLFIFDEESTRSFWMKNTFIDLAIGFFDSKKKLVDIQEMKATKSMMETRPPSYFSKAPAMYALEVPKGWFKKNKISLGEKFALDRSRGK